MVIHDLDDDLDPPDFRKPPNDPLIYLVFPWPFCKVVLDRQTDSVGALLIIAVIGGCIPITWHQTWPTYGFSMAIFYHFPLPSLTKLLNNYLPSY